MGQGDVVCSRMGLPELDTERKREVSMTIRGDKEALEAVWETERGRKCVCVCVCVCVRAPQREVGKCEDIGRKKTQGQDFQVIKKGGGCLKL